MIYAKIIEDYEVLILTEGGIPSGDDDDCVNVCQYCGEELQYWKTRDNDGFHFVFSDRLNIGYWVHPRLVAIKEVDQ
jgi:hypothetical protein